jgi:hypothetical protein
MTLSKVFNHRYYLQFSQSKTCFALFDKDLSFYKSLAVLERSISFSKAKMPKNTKQAQNSSFSFNRSDS